MTTLLEQRIQTAVERIRAANDRYFNLEFDEDSPQVLNPPATDESLAAVAVRFGMPLPPSYRAFLSLHDGWLDISGGAMILPSGEHDTDWVRARTQRIREHLAEFADPSVLNHAFMVMLGEDEPNFAYLDKAVLRGDGECQVVHSDLIYGELGRYPDFISYLEAIADTKEKLIAKTR